MEASSPSGVELRGEGHLVIDGVEWMVGAEVGLMRAAAMCARGHVLEVGYGAGVAHKALHDNLAVSSITVIERDPRVVEQIMRAQCSACAVHVGDYRDMLLPSGPSGQGFDTIFFDTAIGPASRSEIGPLLPLLADNGIFLRYYRRHEHELGKVESLRLMHVASAG